MSDNGKIYRPAAFNRPAAKPERSVTPDTERGIFQTIMVGNFVEEETGEPPDLSDDAAEESIPAQEFERRFSDWFDASPLYEQGAEIKRYGKRIFIDIPIGNNVAQLLKDMKDKCGGEDIFTYDTCDPPDATFFKMIYSEDPDKTGYIPPGYRVDD